MTTAGPNVEAPCPVCRAYGVIPKGTHPDGSARVELCSCAKTCSRCDGDGQVPYEDDQGREILHACPDCKGPRGYVHLHRWAGLPARDGLEDAELGNYRVNTPRQAVALRDVSRWASEYTKNGRGFLLRGPAGTGKTHLAVGAAKRLIWRQYRTIFVEVGDLLAKFKELYDGDDKLTASAYRRRLLDVPVLVLDDLPILRTEWQQETVSDLVKTRYNSGRTLVITTNLSGKPKKPGQPSLQTAFGEESGRILSRLREACESFVVDGEDYREERVRQLTSPTPTPEEVQT